MANPLRSGRIYLWGLLALLAMWAGVDWYVAYPLDVQVSYVGRQSCARCHESQLHLWHGSDHDRAMELASDETVLGDFNDVTFTRLGVTTRFFRRGKQFFVNTEGPDGELHDYEIKYTFGVRPLQQYMVEFPDGRVQVLRVSWDAEKNEWFYVAPPDVPDQRLEPGDPLHWTGMGQNWNTMCADCHSTDLKKNFDLANNRYNTTFAEIDVSCEACHGPGSLHEKLAESRSLFWDRRHGYGLAGLKDASAQQQIETCAPCHSRRTRIHENYHRGDRFADDYEPSLIHAGLYHVDGQILDEVYVYGSFLQSKMYANGIRCTDCHDPHSLKLKFQGNRLCGQCHQPGKYDSPNHHHHQDVVASECVSCHMPARTYMEIDARRDHSLRIPRPDLSETLGTPNACNACHTKPEETSAWAAEKIRDWYGDRRPDDPHYANAIAAARQGSAEGLDLVRKLLHRLATPSIIRATALDLLAGYDSPKADRMCLDAINDSDPLVRTAAMRAISGRALGQALSEMAILLSDPVRLVRITAARRLAPYAPQLADPKSRSALEHAIDQYRQAQKPMLDRAGAHMNLAAMSQTLGDSASAAVSLRTAIQLEPYLSGVRDQLAQLLERTGNNPEEVRRLRTEEVELLERDSKLLPDNPRPLYRRGMLLYLLNRYDEARAAFEQACKVAPDSYDNWLALALLCEKQRRTEQAIEALKQMERLRPGDPAISGIYQRMEQTQDSP